MDKKVLLYEICERSAKGEGVIAIINSMGLPELETLKDLQENHAGEIRAAKLKQLSEKS